MAIPTSKSRRNSPILARRPRAALALFALAGAWIVGIGACSTPDSAPHDTDLDDAPNASNASAQTIAPPGLAGVPQPDGFTVSDIRLLFEQKDAPTIPSLKNCDDEFNKLSKLTESEDEIREGARELVRKDPVHYHWCFYSKVIALENVLASDAFIIDRQKAVLDTYSFLVPIARAFMDEFRDSRYVRWAAFRYRQISERVFFRRLELSPEATEEFVDVANPFGQWHDHADTGNPSPDHVLEKYHLAEPQALAPQPAVTPSSDAETAAAIAASMQAPPPPAPAYDPDLDPAPGTATPPGVLPQAAGVTDSVPQSVPAAGSAGAAAGAANPVTRLPASSPAR